MKFYQRKSKGLSLGVDAVDAWGLEIESEGKRIDVSCQFDGFEEKRLKIIAPADVALAKMQAVRPAGGKGHVNHLEILSQIGLIKHALQYGVDFVLHDDHWGITSFAFLALFESGDAKLETGGAIYQFSDLTKEDWSDVQGPLAGVGGFQYIAPSGKMLLKRETWIS